MAEEKPRRRSLHKPDDFPCPICGESDFEWGYPKGNRGAAILFSEKQGVDRWKIQGDKMRARKCLSCGNVQLFAMD